MIRLLVSSVAVLLLVGCGSSKCADGATCEGEGGSGASAGASAAGSSPEGGKADGGRSSSGGAATAGKGPGVECPPECLVAVSCVKACGGKPVSIGCCPCVDPAFDSRMCD